MCGNKKKEERESEGEDKNATYIPGLVSMFVAKIGIFHS